MRLVETPLPSPPRREPEETREHGEEEAIEDYSALPAPVGVSDSWAEPAAASVPTGFGTADGFEAAGGCDWMWAGMRESGSSEVDVSGHGVPCLCMMIPI